MCFEGGGKCKNSDSWGVDEACRGVLCCIMRWCSILAALSSSLESELACCRRHCELE